MQNAIESYDAQRRINDPIKKKGNIIYGNYRIFVVVCVGLHMLYERARCVTGRRRIIEGSVADIICP